MAELTDFVQQEMTYDFRDEEQFIETDSDWISQTPSNWSVMKIARCLKSLDSGSRESYEGEDGAFSIGGEHITEKGDLSTENDNFVSYEFYRSMNGGQLRTDDVLLVKDGATIGKNAIVDEIPHGKAAVNSHVYLLRGKEFCSNRFLYYLIDSEIVQEQIQVSITGSAQEGLSRKFTKFVDVPMPPLKEQKAIVDFLNQETKNIDNLIEKKEELINLIEERRQAVIKNAVIKGLDPEVNLRDSGVDWLGQVPDHWEVPRIRFVARMESGHTPSKSEDGYWDGDIPWVSLADSGWMREHDYISETDKTISEEGLANSSAHILPPETMVFTRDATVGLCAITTREMAVSQHIIGWICEDNLLPEYLLNVTKAMDQELDRLTMGATISTVGMEDIKKLKMPLPPIEEQKEIVDYLNKELEKFDDSTEKILEGIERLKEYRTALITEAVTGQIDVRGEI